MTELDSFDLDLDDAPCWSESSWFSWAIPDRGINGFFYDHLRPNMRCMLAGPAMWDASGEHVWKFRYFDRQGMRLLPDGKCSVDYDNYDFATPWGMSQYMADQIFSHDCFDLVLDSGSMRPREVAEAIPMRLDEGPGEAFSALAEQFGGARLGDA